RERPPGRRSSATNGRGDSRVRAALHGCMPPGPLRISSRGHRVDREDHERRRRRPGNSDRSIRAVVAPRTTPRRATELRGNGVFFAPPRRMPSRVAGARRVAVCSLVGVVLTFLATPARALHKESPGAYRITSGGSHYYTPGRAWERHVPFSSTEDLVKTGNNRREIFIFHLAYFDCFNGTTFPTTPCANPLPPFLEQVTNGPGEPDNPTPAQAFDND